MLFLADYNITISIPAFSLTTIVRGLQVSFCICSLPGHMTRTKKMLVDAKVHCPIFLFNLLLLLIYVCVCFYEDFEESDIPRHGQSWMYHTCSWISSILNILSQLEVQLSINYGGSGDHLLIKVQVSIMFRRVMCHLDMVLDHIGQWHSPNSPYKLDVQHYVLHSFCSIVPINFGHLNLSDFFCSSFHLCQYIRTDMLLTHLMCKPWSNAPAC